MQGRGAGAAFEQDQMLQYLTRLARRLQDMAATIDDWRDNPRFPEQKREQETLVADIEHVVERASSMGETVARDSAVSSVANQLKTALFGAADCGRGAAAALGEERAEAANRDQNEVIRLLTKLVDAMKNLADEQLSEMLEDVIESWMALVQRMLLTQKTCSAGTAAVWARRLPDGTYGRAEDLQLRALAKAQSGMERDLKTADRIAKYTGTHVGREWTRGQLDRAAREDETVGRSATGFNRLQTVIFEILGELVPDAGRRLAAQDAGPGTQEVQKRIERLLEQILGAFNKESDNPNASQPMSWNGLGSDNAANDQEPLELVISLQETVNMRTRQIEERRRSGAATAEEIEAQLARVRELQELVFGVVEGVLREHNETWMTDGFVADRH